MYLIRDIMYCKPGKVRAMVEKYHAMNKLTESMGLGAMRVMTDYGGERYWTVIAEIEVPSIEEYETTGQKMMADPKFQDIMKGYHELVDSGRREIFRIEK
ncbi:MAG: hypothetical protein ACRD2N_05600 [Vicinamibacterales bacterium]